MGAAWYGECCCLFERMKWLSGIAELSSESLPGFKPLGFNPRM
jgi:hypothetical protein